MKKILFIAFIFLGVANSSQAQKTEISPNYLVIPSVLSFPTCSKSGKLVFKTPENKLYICNGNSWEMLSSIPNHALSAKAKCCVNYTAFPTVVDFSEPDFDDGNGFISAIDVYTVQSSGTYLLNASFTAATADNNPVNYSLTVYIVKNNHIIRSNVQNNNSSAFNASSRLTEVIKLNAGDNIQIKVSHNYSNQSNNTITAGSDGSYFNIVRLY